MSKEVRVRNFSSEMRAEKREDGKMIVSGYAVVYNQETDIWGDKEIILPGAGTRTLAEDDQFYFWQHDSATPLARKSIKTLVAKEDEKGIWIEAELIDSQVGRDAFAAISSGLVDKQSFAFTVSKDKWETEDRDGEKIWVRTIEEFDTIYEFSAVTFPAYEGTDVGKRSKEESQKLARRNKPEPSGDDNTAVLEVLKDARSNIKQMQGASSDY